MRQEGASVPPALKLIKHCEEETFYMKQAIPFAE